MWWLWIMEISENGVALQAAGRCGHENYLRVWRRGQGASGVKAPAGLRLSNARVVYET